MTSVLHENSSVEIVAYSSAHREAVERLNAKLSAAGSEWQFSPEERPPNTEQLAVWTESFVVEEGHEIYGGYILKHQEFFLEGSPIELGDLQLPLSLGQIDSTFSRVSVALLFDVLRRSPSIYSLGLGSEDTQFAKLLTAAGWQHATVPFYFSVKAANRFAQNIRLSSERATTQKLLSLLGRIRLAGVALRLRKSLGRQSASRLPRGIYDDVREVSHFGTAADELFAAHAKSYSLVGDRRSAALGCLYPSHEKRYLRVVVASGGRAIGWAVLLDTQMANDKYFGDLRVGSLADCFAAPQDAPAVVAAVDDFLTRLGVDIVVSNQLHPEWCTALEAADYEAGPSNFFFYFSEDFAKQLEAIPDWDQRVHLNRGDGEGPTHL